MTWTLLHITAKCNSERIFLNRSIFLKVIFYGPPCRPISHTIFDPSKILIVPVSYQVLRLFMPPQAIHGGSHYVSTTSRYLSRCPVPTSTFYIRFARLLNGFRWNLGPRRWSLPPTDELFTFLAKLAHGQEQDMKIENSNRRPKVATT